MKNVFLTVVLALSLAVLSGCKARYPREVLVGLIDSLVMSQIRYCAQVYGSAGPSVGVN